MFNCLLISKFRSSLFRERAPRAKMRMPAVKNKKFLVFIIVLRVTKYPEANMEDVKLMTTGEYAGIGAVISKKGDHVIIREPYKGFPADKAGLLPGLYCVLQSYRQNRGSPVS